MVDFKSPVFCTTIEGSPHFLVHFLHPHHGRSIANHGRVAFGGVPVDSHEFFQLKGTKNPSASWKNMKKTDRKSR